MHLVTRLRVALVGIVEAIAIISGVSIYKPEEAQLLNVVIMGADQLSGSISGATWHAMLADRRADAYQVMEAIAVKQGIHRLSMYNRAGEITFCTNPADRGRVEDPNSERCRGCHAQGETAGKARPARPRAHPRIDDRAAPPVRDYAHPQRAPVRQRRLPRAPQGDARARAAGSEPQPGPGGRRAHVHAAAHRLARHRRNRSHLPPHFFARGFIRHLIEQLIEGANAISRMDLAKPVPAPAHAGEITELAASFDLMRVRPRDALAEINQFTHKLEGKVAERTQELKVAHRKMLQSDRLASLGRLSASVEHEINNPIAGVLNLARLMRRVLKDDGIPPERGGRPDFGLHPGEEMPLEDVGALQEGLPRGKLHVRFVGRGCLLGDNIYRGTNLIANISA